MLRKILLIFVCFLCLAGSAVAMETVLRQVPGAQKVGTARMTFSLWDVYDATLYAPNGQFRPNTSFILSLHYLRDLDGAAIAERSVEEMKKQGFSDEAKLAVWNGQMKAIFPDVANGTVLSAVFISGQKTVFYNGEKPIGTIADAEFTRQFSNIWLGEKTSEPGMRRKLLGGA